MVRIKVITISYCAVPVIPQFYKGISLYKEADKYAQCGKQQDCSENRIDTADNLINREYRSDQIINKDHTVDHPCGNGCSRSVKSKDLSSRDIARCIDEYCANQQKQQTAEYLIYSIYAFIAVFTDRLRHLRTAVS